MNYLQVMKAQEGYTIQRGDTLSSLAKRYGTTVEALAKANNISDVNKIFAGKKLIIPAAEVKADTDPIYYGGQLPEVTVVPNYPINEREISNGFVAAQVGSPRTWTFNKEGVTYYPTGVKVTVDGTQVPYTMDELDNVHMRDIDVYGFEKVPFKKSNIYAEAPSAEVAMPARVVNYVQAVSARKPGLLARIRERRSAKQNQA